MTAHVVPPIASEEELAAIEARAIAGPAPLWSANDTLALIATVRLLQASHAAEASPVRDRAVASAMIKALRKRHAKQIEHLAAVARDLAAEPVRLNEEIARLQAVIGQAEQFVLQAGRVVPCVAALVTNLKDRLLLVQTHRGWELPGGRMEPGETWRAALCRELLEETGLAVTLDPGHPRVLDGMPVAGAKYQSVIIIARGMVFTPCAAVAPSAGDVVREARWFEPRALPDDLSPIATRVVVWEWRGKIRERARAATEAGHAEPDPGNLGPDEVCPDCRGPCEEWELDEEPCGGEPDDEPEDET